MINKWSKDGWTTAHFDRCSEELDELRTEAEELNWFIEFYKHPNCKELLKIFGKFLDMDLRSYGFLSPTDAVKIATLQGKEERTRTFIDLMSDPHDRKKSIDSRIKELVDALKELDEVPTDRRRFLRPSLSELVQEGDLDAAE